MKDQRGSVTVISLAMLLFLMVVAVAWLPMMTMEKTAAASDYREQQAWNAAEAGYKRAVAALSNKNNDWRWLTPEEYIRDSDSANFAHLSIDGNKVDQDEIWYAVSIMGNNADIVSGYIPEEDVVYQITAVGSCQGVRKVIRKTYVLGDDDSFGGGDSGGEETLELPGLVQAGGTVTITNNQAGELNGDLYGSGFFDSSGNQFSSGHTQGTYPNTLKTHIPESVFQKENYTEMERRVLHLARKARLSCAEILACIANDEIDTSIGNQSELQKEKARDNLGFFLWFCDGHRKALEAISTLYLNKDIIFDKRK